MAKTVFVTERAERHQRNVLDAAPPELEITMLREPDTETLNRSLRQATYLITERRGIVDMAVLAAAPSLQLVLRLGSQTHDIDLEAASQRGVRVAYWPQPSVIRVAEHTIMQMLVVLKRLNEVQAITHQASENWGVSRRTDENTFAYNWSGRSGLGSLWQKRVGILGFGEIGVEIARRLAGWGCTVWYNKRTQLPQPIEAGLVIRYATSEAIISESDVLVNLLPYSQRTDTALSQERIAAMKSGAILVSTGSGSVIDEAALAAAVCAGKLSGAALDTYEYEPLRQDNPLRLAAMDGFNIVLTPHTAAVGDTASEQEIREQYTNIVRHMAGEPLLYQLV